MNKKIFLASSLVMVIFSAIFILSTRKKVSSDSNALTIGIIQTISHPALDLVQEGFIEEVTKAHDIKFKIFFEKQNAHGSASQAHLIAQKFKAHTNIKAILTIGTMATQAVVTAVPSKPHFFAAVTDPQSIGIAKASYACGSSDMVDMEKTVQLLLWLAPQAMTVAILYNPGEANSRSLVQTMKNILNRHDKKVLEIGVTSPSEIRAAALIATQNADALVSPTDNTIAIVLPTIVEIATAAKKPFIVCDNILVPHGALAACGVDYKEQGKLAAQCALKILKKEKKAEEIGILYPTCSTTVINKKMVEKLGLKLPEELQTVAHFV